jgi:C4-dicarboxylate-specific signal transduction histidine kinase
LELTHVARMATLNAMTASITHEVSQPISGVLTNSNTCARMLAADPPNVMGAAETVRRTIRDANRVAEVIKRLRAMFAKKAPTMEMVDLNEAALEVIAMSSAELRGSRSVLQTGLELSWSRRRSRWRQHQTAGAGRRRRGGSAQHGEAVRSLLHDQSAWLGHWSGDQPFDHRES